MEKLEKLPEHHAICFEATDRDFCMSAIKEILEKNKTHFEVIDQKLLEIESSRYISTWNEKEFGQKKVMIISFHSASHPAQNALLKVLEEPKLNTQFILITSNVNNLLPTVRSRLLMQSFESRVQADDEITIFLQSMPGDRMEIKFINKMVNEKDDEGRKDRERTQVFLSALLHRLSRSEVDKIIMKEIADCVIYAGDPSSSVKMIMEYVSLRLPRIMLK